MMLAVLNISSTFNTHCCLPQVPNLVFLAVSPEEKESWVHALNVAIVKAKNRVLDQVPAAQLLCVHSSV